MAYERPIYDLFFYAAFRQSIFLPTEPRAEFEAWLEAQGWRAEDCLSLDRWEQTWNRFIDDRDTADQSERSDGLEDTADAALGGHFEPVAL